jgi:uncharacterized protein YoxC
MVIERRETLGVWLDRLLIAAVACVFVYFGTKVEDLTKKVGTLSEAMASIVGEIRFTNEKTDKLYERFEKHLEEDRQDKARRQRN